MKFAFVTSRQILTAYQLTEIPCATLYDVDRLVNHWSLGALTDWHRTLAEDLIILGNQHYNLYCTYMGNINDKIVKTDLIIQYNLQHILMKITITSPYVDKLFWADVKWRFLIRDMDSTSTLLNGGKHIWKINYNSLLSHNSFL